MADPAELIDGLARDYAGKHWVEAEDYTPAYDGFIAGYKAALTPTPSAEDAAVLMAFQAAAIDAYTQHDGPSELDAKREQLRAAVLARMAGKPTWQTIDTAPKNNSSRLVWCPLDKCIYCVAWVDNSEYPPARSGWQVFGGEEIIDGVTHWMPLPAAPESPR